MEFTGRFAAEIARLYPGCPPSRVEAIATHAGLRGSGRVGRSAAGRNLDEKAVTLAVIASIRHLDTDYDELLMSGVARPDARERSLPGNRGGARLLVAVASERLTAALSRR